jgi:hypothetical protein
VIGWSLSQLLQGILSSVYLDGNKVQGWKMFPIPLHNLNEVSNYNPIIQAAYSAFGEKSTSRKRLLNKSGMYQNTYGMKNTIPFPITALLSVSCVMLNHHFIGFYIDDVNL